jgi:hypothetical protein
MSIRDEALDTVAHRKAVINHLFDEHGHEPPPGRNPITLHLALHEREGTHSHIWGTGHGYVKTALDITDLPDVEACDERPEIQISLTTKDAKMTTDAMKVLTAMHDAFSCDLPADHSGDHTAHDADGNPLVIWPSR